MAEIRGRITSGALPLGARISDKHLAAELAVSRTPVREALVQLRAEGLVVMRPQSGTFVFDLAPSNVRQICAARSVLETGALKIALARSGDRPAGLAVLIGQAAVALEEGRLATCDELDCRFHEDLVAASGNAYLIDCYRRISDKLRALRQRMPRDPDRMSRALAQHRHILDLWLARRADRAIDELAAHLDNVERLLSALGE